MERFVIDSRFVTLLIHSGESISRGQAEALVREALKEAGLQPWPGMSIELFPGHGDTLLMAAPLDGCSVYVADYALPFFGLFTE
ncbi:MAG: hypothetical protein ACI4PC_06510 [Oscillospiraceae bacterium]